MKMKVMKRSLVSMVLLLVMLCAMSVVTMAAEPTNLVQVSDTETSVKVQWSGIDTAKYYGVQVATDANFTNVIKQDYSYSYSNDMYISGLVAGSSYYVRVGWGTSRTDCYANFSTAIEVVTTPTRVLAAKFVGAADTTFTLSWDAQTGANVWYVTYNNEKIPVATNAATLTYYAGADSASVTCARMNAAGTYIAENTSSARVYDLTALTSKISKDNFGFRNAWTAINQFQISAIYNGHGLDVAVYDAKTGKKKFSGSCRNTSYSSAEFSNFKYNTAYKYRVRPYITTTDGQKLYGNWSAYRYFVNPKTTKYTVSGKKIKLSWSKLKGVAKVKIQISTKENSGYKTCATLNPSKKTTYTITKYGKKALKKGKKYYIRMTYYTKAGKKTYTNDIISTASTTIN